MGNYLNPSLKGVHLAHLEKLDDVKNKMLEALDEWKPQEEIALLERENSEPRKLTATERLKQQMREQKEKAPRGRPQGDGQRRAVCSPANLPM